MVEPKNYRIKSFVRERDFLANNFKNSYGYYLLDKLVNRGDKSVHINLGDAFAQGIFMEYGITEDDRVETFRNGGFGSTDKNK